MIIAMSWEPKVVNDVHAPKTGNIGMQLIANNVSKTILKEQDKYQQQLLQQH